MKIKPEKRIYLNAHNTKIARQFQRELWKFFERRCLLKMDKIDLIAGCDVSYRRDKARACVCIYSFKRKKIIEEICIEEKISFPYIPTFLSFREAPPLISAIEKIKSKPELYIFDGQGLAHPLRMGLATHMGCLLEKPTIGFAKSHLYGVFEEPPNIKGAYTFLKTESGEIIGAVLRTRKDTKPVFASIGWGVDVAFVIDIIMELVSRYKIPDILRRADYLTKNRRKNDKGTCS
ncbi:MAG: endonuclease V [Elusimicrobia bacterium]|nr:endonuclease V [Elusimicrobiota bacterium]